MKRARFIVAGSLLMAFLSSGLTHAKDERLERLTAEHRKWIEEEVVYITTDREREFFLSLETAEEREHFIESFWRKRDPNPATPENEFRDEHYRRLDYANSVLGRDSFRPGWKTDRGRMYILLGEPRERQRYDGAKEIVSTELWFYQSEPGSGLPAFFYLLFFRPRDIGEYRLYHPAIDGPRALLRGRYASLESTNSKDILITLSDVSPELGRASLSLDPSDPGDYATGRVSLGTDILLARISEAPKRRVRTDYLAAASRYGDRVSADYSFNFVPNRNAFAVLFSPEGFPIAHYTVELEPQDFALETDERRSKFYTVVDVTLEVRDAEGQLVYSKETEAEVELTPSQMEQVKESPFAFQDSFPIVAGRYTLSVILKNRVMKRYTVAEHEIYVHAPERGKPALSDIVAAFDSETSSSESSRSFQMGRYRVYPAADHLFSIGETVQGFVQVKGAEPAFTICFLLMDGEQLLRERVVKVGDFQGDVVREALSLIEIVGGRYALRAQLLDESGTLVAERETPVQVTPRTAVRRAGYTHRSGFDVAAPGLLALTRGEELLALKRFDEARSELEKAVAMNNPQLPMARWKLAGLYLREEEPQRALELLLPLESEYPDQYEVVAGLGFSYYFGHDFEKAARYLDRAVAIRPPSASLLNALGESCERTGALDRARAAFERSLALNPDQKAVEERLASLGAKKSR